MREKKSKAWWDNIHLSYTGENIFPGFSIDCVILTFHKGRIRVLLRKVDPQSYWALLGGFMFKNEDSDQAAKRILNGYLGLDNIYLRQFQLFSAIERTKKVQNVEYALNLGTESNSWDWLFGRFISMGYFALIKYNEVNIPAELKSNLKWFDIKDLPDMYADHDNIVNTAMNIIRAILPAIPVGYALLPEKFTMTELRQVYEIILEKTFDRRNFHRKALAEGNIIELEEKKDDRKYNPPSLFSFKKEIIDSLKNDNIGPIT